jgi:lipoprotein-anchoring transpeptidase ErfK/SrfK
VTVTTTAPTIAPDVTVVGIHVGGLTVEEATKVIEDRLVHKMTAPIVVHLGSRTYKLRSGPGKFVMDAARMARSAGRFKPLKPGSTKQRDVGPAIKHSPAAVKAFVAGLVKAIYRAPRSARVKLGITKMKLYRSRGGRTIDTAKTAWLINRALDHLGANRVLRVKTKWIAPAVTPDGLRRRYLHVITVDRGTHTLRLFTKLKLAKRYGVAVGMAGLSTPAGHYAIQDKQVDPAWHVPNSAWAGARAGQTIPGGAPNNPLKARWMGLADGVGIHGTSEDWSIGSDASHGCIRMHVWDVKELYARVSVGTPVLIR